MKNKRLNVLHQSIIKIIQGKQRTCRHVTAEMIP